MLRHLALLLLICFAAFGNGNLIVQPRFVWADGTATLQGTASFVKTPRHTIAALTSAHFINFLGPKLLRIEWLDIHTGDVVATSIRTWGLPGKEGCYDPLDLRSDYLFAVVRGKSLFENALEIEARPPEIGERVWFPNKNPQSVLGFERVEGTVIDSRENYCVVTLDKIIELDSRSGTPVVSKTTGKIMGILTGGDEKDGQTILCVVPGTALYKALMNAETFPLLRKVVGVEK